MSTPTIEAQREIAEQVKRFLSVYAPGPEDVVAELRALKVPQRYGNPKTIRGYFELPSRQKEFLAAVRELVLRSEGMPEGVYVTLNPLVIDILARADNRLKPIFGNDAAATDDNVTCRRWMLVDVDPSRIAGVSSTDAEKAEAWRVIEAVRADLDGRRWPPPSMVIDSGNGYHLWYRIDRPRDDAVVEKTLKYLAGRHDTRGAKVDTTVFNPSRIAKLPGTWACKGDSVPRLGRVHRMSQILEMPAAPLATAEVAPA